MPIEQIITIIIVVLVAVFAWTIFKKLFKLMFYVGIIIFLILAANLFFIYQDLNDLKKNFGVLEKKVILKEDDRILIGLVLNDDPVIMTDKQMNDYSLYLENKEYEKILDDSYKLMVFDIKIISKIEGNIETVYQTYTKEQSITTLKSDNTPKEEKATLFSTILADEILSSKNPLFFFSEIKKGNIIIYPDTALFKTLRFIPLSFIKDVSVKIFDKTKEKAKTIIVEEI